MPKQVDLTTGQEVPLDPKVVKIINHEPTTMRDFAERAMSKEMTIQEAVKICEEDKEDYLECYPETAKFTEIWQAWEMLIQHAKDVKDKWLVSEDEATVCEPPNTKAMEDKIFDIVTDLIRDDITKDEAIDKLLILHNANESFSK